MSMGDSYITNNKGQIGALGNSAQNYGSLSQFSLPSGVDGEQLKVELNRLKAALAAQASGADEYHAVAEVESARKSLEEADESAAMRHLKKAGQWALDTAIKIGAPIAEAAIRAAIGL